MGAAAPIPGEIRLRVDRAVRLSCDEVEPSDMAVYDQGRLAEPGRA